MVPMAAFIFEEHGMENIFLKTVSEDCKTLMLSMFMVDQKRLFKLSPSTAGIRKWFTDSGQPVEWLHSIELNNMRQGKHLSADAKKDLTDSKVKVCVSLQTARSWLSWITMDTKLPEGEASPY